ncbi:hypothetical protein [Chitinilyticum piscinae]|uniref:Uncharacterized protein n=1 Tax=Chitinilyticum piscinae TaxID=2866724 RepID=A0A8J7FZ63_9NEIS|nr:hypothetical protein [Chitinilyticum piscinae]MBE9608378.1 hypothetical protein [Chitinilyticum piscinae]
MLKRLCLTLLLLPLPAFAAPALWQTLDCGDAGVLSYSYQRQGKQLAITQGGQTTILPAQRNHGAPRYGNRNLQITLATTPVVVRQKQQQPCTRQNGPLWENAEKGIRLQLPASWPMEQIKLGFVRDETAALLAPGATAFTQFNWADTGGHPAVLARLVVYPRAAWEEQLSSNPELQAQWLGENGLYVWALQQPANPGITPGSSNARRLDGMRQDMDQWRAAFSVSTTASDSD